MPAPANPDVAWAIEDIRANLPRRQKAVDYYEGRHQLNFATPKFRNTFGDMFQELRDNLCDDVVDEMANRLAIDSWGGAASTRAQEWWEANRGDARAGAVHQHGARAGDAFVIVWAEGDDMEPRPYVQDPRQMAVRYSAADPDHLEVAAKCWREGKGYRLTLYYPATDTDRARIERYYSKGVSNTSGEKGIPQANAFQPYMAAEVVGPDGQVVKDAVDWLEYHDHGMPVFHFPNGELGAYGSSQLRDVFPLQDALNKVLADFMVAGEDYSLPKRWANGIEVVIDPVTGKEESPFKEGRNLWWTRSKDADFGQFPAAEMKGFLDAMDALTLKIARKGGLPPHAVNLWQSGGGDAPSGLSLLLAEGKLVKLCKDRQRDWGVVWRELVAYALSWSGAPVKPQDLEDGWADPETRDEKGHLETLTLKKGLVGAVVPDAQFALEVGYTDKELKEFADVKEEETAKKLEAAQAAMGGRISPPGTGFQPGGQQAPTPPAPPAGAAQPQPTRA